MPKGGPEQQADIPIEKRLSGDLGSPLELLAAKGLSDAQKREVLHVWLKDLEAQADTPQRRATLASVRQALDTIAGSDRARGEPPDAQSRGEDRS